ncbi:flagellar hook assembly protein FlgD [Coralliovum pocilloporae]|uniref:flagellar hook assembly protein FlgD n=1 Tax=Coralliovum pocilloporae TaxID=3066369 RepID=UPI003306C637
MEISSTNPAGNGQTSSSQTRLAADLDTFLTLLTTQLQNQNPLEPLEAEQFTQQLTQFTAIEQQIQTNDKLDSLITASATQFASSIINYVGRTITADGSRATLDEGRAQWTFESDEATDDGLVAVVNARGDIVFEQKISIKEGQQNFVWNGKNDDGEFAPEGTYRLEVIGRDSNGLPIDVSTEISGTVSKVDVTKSPPELTVGSAQVPLTTIQSVATGS